jgi:hypothetical protein
MSHAPFSVDAIPQAGRGIRGDGSTGGPLEQRVSGAGLIFASLAWPVSSVGRPLGAA